MEKVVLNSEHSFTNSFSEADVAHFAELSKDDNPLHLDASYAEQTIFKKRVVHGVLITGMFSKIFGTIYPGNGGIYLSQSSKFLRPAYLNDSITAKVTLTSFDDEKKRGIFKCEAFNQDEKLILVGEAEILFPNHFELKE
jgi:3-hydroxybutyryl-CoA dehydratase